MHQMLLEASIPIFSMAMGTKYVGEEVFLCRTCMTIYRPYRSAELTRQNVFDLGLFQNMSLIDRSQLVQLFKQAISLRSPETLEYVPWSWVTWSHFCPSPPQQTQMAESRN